MYQNYLFDLYGTLIDINTDEQSPELWEKLALLYGYKGAIYTGKEIHEEYVRLVQVEKQNVRKAHSDFTEIDILIDNVFKKLFTQKKVRATKKDIEFIAAAFRCYSTKYIRLYDGVVDLLETLKAKGKKVYLLSNAQRSFTLNEMVMLNIVKYFDGIYISSDKLVSKPDTKYFDMLIDEYGLDKSQTVMIGNDYISDIQGAYNAGIDSLYIHQSISPDIQGELKAKWAIMDGDVYKIKEYIVK
ncbi:MAG: HAD family hydrolase [Acutalibacteraceae bacterium]